MAPSDAKSKSLEAEFDIAVELSALNGQTEQKLNAKLNFNSNSLMDLLTRYFDSMISINVLAKQLSSDNIYKYVDFLFI